MIITVTNFHRVSMKAYNKISDKNVLYDEPNFLLYRFRETSISNVSYA